MTDDVAPATEDNELQASVRLSPRRALDLLLAGGRPVTLAVLLVLALVAGFLEAAVILVVLTTAAALAAESGQVDAGVGPIELSLSIGDGILLGLVVTAALVASAVPSAWLSARIAAGTLARLRSDLLRSLLAAPWQQQSMVTEARFQDLASVHVLRVANLVLALATLLTAALALAALLVAALVVDPAIAGTLLVVVVALAVVFRPLISGIRRRTSDFITAHHVYVERLAEMFRVLPEIRVLGVGGPTAKTLDEANQIAVGEFRYSRFRARLLPTLYTGATVLLILLGLALASTQEGLDLVSLGAIIVFLLRALRYSQQVQSSWQIVSELLPYYERIQTAMRDWTPTADRRGTTTLERARHLELQDVGYVYPTGQIGIDGVTVTLEGGEIVGLDGPSGAGKSTLAQLILGLRRPTSGRYLVDGVPMESIEESSWFARFAYVAQDPMLVRGSVRDNVRFLRSEVSDDDIDRALEEAGLGSDLAGWADGASHEVGSGGRELSGGQRQRVAIARALAGRPDVLVMDEPTSSLDADAEEIVRGTLTRLRGRITVILIAHRRSTLEVCDRVLTVRQHRVLPDEAATESRRVDPAEPRG